MGFGSAKKTFDTAAVRHARVEITRVGAATDTRNPNDFIAAALKTVLEGVKRSLGFTLRKT